MLCMVYPGICAVTGVSLIAKYKWLLQNFCSFSTKDLEYPYCFGLHTFLGEIGLCPVISVPSPTTAVVTSCFG